MSSVNCNLDSMSRDSLIAYLKFLKIDLIENEPSEIIGNNHMTYFADHDDWENYLAAVNTLINWLD